MNKPDFKVAAMAAGIAMALVGTATEASHFRGAAMIPTVSASGLLTVNATSFWRPTGVGDIDESAPIAVSGVGNMSQVGAQVNDTTDSRFTKVTSVHTVQLTGAALYTLSASSCCRVGGTSNTASNTWTMNSSIFWDGTSAATPILFNFSNVQLEVQRGVVYNGNLGALGGAGLTLSYDQALNAGIFSQPPGFTINTATGALNIPAASSLLPNYPDNTGGNVGADAAFSGNIFARDAAGALRGQVEFEWLFDAVTSASNNAPSITDVIINALVGAVVNTTLVAGDDGLPIPPGALSWTDIGLLGALGTCSFIPTFNTGTQAFNWNTAGCAVGSYIYQVQVSDSLLTDFGTVTVNLTTGGQPPGVPEPGTLALIGLAGLGLGAFTRRRKSK